MKVTALSAELRVSQKEFGDKNYLQIQTTSPNPVSVGNPLPLEQIKSKVTEFREFFKVSFCSAVSRGRYCSVLLKADVYCGGLSFGTKILLSEGCKYTRIPPPLEEHG